MAVQYYRPTNHIWNSSDKGKTWNPITIENETLGFWSTGMSSDGKYRIISSINCNVYISSTFGITWEKININNDSEVNVGISGNGKYMTFTTYNDNPNYDDDGGKVWRSDDYGSSWTNVTPTFNVPGYYYGVAISRNGEYQTLTITASARGDTEFLSSIVTSDDYGLTWTRRTTDGNKYLGENICSNAMSYDGKYQIAGDYGDESAGIYKSKDYGKTWEFIKTEENDLWIAGAISEDGKCQIYVSQKPYVIIRSNDYGETWTRSTFISPSSIYGVAISGSGKNVLLTPTTLKLYNSDDFGETWSNDNNTTGYKAISDISSSLDCKYQSATILNGKIISSKDYGVTWNEILDDDEWRSISISSDGSYQTALTTTHINVSNDYGSTWKKINRTNYGPCNVKVSDSGQYQTYAEYSGYIYVSNDWGESWKKAVINNDDSSVEIALFYNSPAMTSDGKTQFICDMLGTNFTGNGCVYKSNDYGATWNNIKNIGEGYWSCIECSSSGKYISAGKYYTGYATSDDFGSTWKYPTTSDTYYNFKFSSDDESRYQFYTRTTTLGYLANYYSTDYGLNYKVLSSVKGYTIFNLSSDAERCTFLASNAILEGVAGVAQEVVDEENP